MSIQSLTLYGKVYLVGAGPGDPDLITVKGSEVLQKADAVVYDRLANPALLSQTSEKAEQIYVGKRPGKPSVSQEQINQIIVTKAKEGKVVARLKGGDSFVFGRGGEECEALRAEHISFEVVPGISSALAAPAFAGIPLTQRKIARSFTVVTGHTIHNTDTFAGWNYYVHADTLVILMGMGRLPQIANQLIGHGRSADTPVAVIEKATYQSQKVITATLSNIAEEAKKLSPPGTIVIGELAAKSKQLAWFTPEKKVGISVSNTNRRTQVVG
ncbi:uroporphyrinogen-III C-methyltransferase [Fodinibius saliphilus]|uniref:uroporphyrinogen-III C-methyltransferase n=1 Tax=Fodinibius saliphilus TaxID=1920650 RepID=UPI001107B23F|nr:uroporphyrinogen-III C-methyltransferase [Fodinibius saliphilus]